MNTFDKANAFIRDSESSLVNLLSAVAPWGAPLAPAYMSFSGMVKHLSYPFPVAIVIACVIEILGLATVHTTLLFWQHNRRYTREYKQMPTLLAGGMFLLYLVIILMVNVILEWPTQWAYTPILARALLSLLSVPAAVTMAIRTQHTEMLNEMRDLKAQKHAQQAHSKLTAGSPEPENIHANSQQGSAKLPQDWRKLTDKQKLALSEMTAPQIEEATGVCERTAWAWKSRLSANGFHAPAEVRD